MGNSRPILLGQNVTRRFFMCSISTNILTVLANFPVITIQFFRKTSVMTVATLVGSEPHPHLENMSSPRHEDHPSVWMEWAKHIARVLPKGLAPGPDRYPYP